jgi:hypothetical protein
MASDRGRSSTSRGEGLVPAPLTRKDLPRRRHRSIMGVENPSLYRESMISLSLYLSNM